MHSKSPRRSTTGKAPAFQFYCGDWLKDPALSMCSPATRGVWMDLLCAMRESREGRLVGSAEQLARLARCSPAELTAAVTELLARKAADGAVVDGKMTLICRRLKREFAERKSHNDRQLRYSRRKSDAPDDAPMTAGWRVDDAPSSNSSSAAQQNKKKKRVRTRAGPTWSPGEGWQGIDAATRQGWEKAFPACDLDRQLAAMGAWLAANPDRARKSNWERFIVNWLVKEQERGGDRRQLGVGNRPHQQTARADGAAQRRADKAAREFPEHDLLVPVRRFGDEAAAASQLRGEGVLAGPAPAGAG